MKWIEDISKAIGYIEDNITEDLKMEFIAKQVFVSPFYFQKGFSMLCGFTVGDYIRQRRLALAGDQLLSTDDKVIDIAMKYGYESPDSFTKAFARFHGATPTAVRRDGALLKSFAPLKIKFTLEGGYIMDYKIVEKDSFKIMGVSKNFDYEKAIKEIPEFWNKHYETGQGEFVHGMYGVSIAENMDKGEFEYLIADDYIAEKNLPEEYVIKTIPSHTWAVFPCKGPMPKSLQDVNQKIFSEWLPNCQDYEIAAGYSVEKYTDIASYPKGNQDENYYSEIWIPLKKK